MARSDVPDWVRKEIPPELNVVFWCRRAWFEVVEELSDSAMWTIVFVLVAYGVYLLFHWLPIFVIAGVLMLIWVWRPFFFEYNRWLHEIYVVARNEDAKGGMFYKFWGGKQGFARKFLDDPITSETPTAIGGPNGVERLWGFMTGEQMQRLTLKGKTNQYVEGRRVTPMLKKAIDSVRHAAPHSEMMELPDAIQWVKQFEHLGASGMWTKEKAQHHIDTVVLQQFYER